MGKVNVHDNAIHWAGGTAVRTWKEVWLDKGGREGAAHLGQVLFWLWHAINLGSRMITAAIRRWHTAMEGNSGQSDRYIDRHAMSRQTSFEISSKRTIAVCVCAFNVFCVLTMSRNSLSRILIYMNVASDRKYFTYLRSTLGSYSLHMIIQVLSCKKPD